MGGDLTWHGKARRAAGAIGLALLLVACGGGEASAPDNAEDGSASEAQLSASRAEAEKHWPAVALPKEAPDAPITPICATKSCAVAKVQFANNDWPKAWAGDYAAQRNVAFCRKTGCEMAVQIDQVEGCAWRQVILETHPSEIDQTDRSNYDLDCGALIGTDTSAAKSKAALILSIASGRSRIN